MNELGELFLRAALQVTILGLVAGVLYGWAARRGPAPAARVTVLALGLCLLLTLAALCPLPSWWSWTAASPVPAATPSVEPPAALEPAAATTADPAGTMSGWSPADVWQGCKAMLPQGPAVGTSQGRWKAILAAAMLAGVGLSLVRLLLGLWAVHACWRRARPIEDVVLGQEVESLRAALGCRRTVAVCEAADLRMPATVGWLRPVLLLPAGWRSWCAAERQAVLAHELAHVARADYLGALIARLSAAVHFYHPVVAWLAGRLRLQQELAADAGAARVMGGPGQYLRALARLALRQDGGPPGWPAASFLFSHGTLLKRIAMLRAKERSESRRTPRPAPLLTVALLLTASLLASTLRGPALTAAPEAGSETRVPAHSPASVRAYEPFDLSYMPPDARGVGAWRPAALFDQPGMKKYAPMMNEFITAMLLERFSGVCLLQKKPLRLNIVDIEQIVSRFHIRSNAKAPAGQRRELLFGWGSMVRTVKDFDWHKQLRDLYPDMVQTHHAGVTYCRIPRPVGFLGPQLGALFPDARTVVLLPEKDLRRWIDHGKEWKTARAWGSPWKQVERDLVAFCARPDDILSASEGDDTTTIALLQAAERISIGIADCAALKVHGCIQCRSSPAGAKWEQSIRGWAAQAADERKPSAQQHPSDEAALLEMAAAMQLVRRGREITVRSESRESLATLLDLQIASQQQTMEPPPSRPNN